MIPDTSVTVVACLTPPGRAAIATLGIAGPAAWDAVRALFRPRSGALPEVPRPGQFWLGRCGDDVADEVVLAVKGGDVPSVEVHCHGGPAVVDLLLDLFAARGLRRCPWPEFLRRTGADALRAEAAVALAAATTPRTAAVLLDQYNGALGAALADAVAALHGGDAARAAAVVAGLARWAPLGRHLTAPWRVVVAGAPNVGKSSLVNALAGYQRSVVSPTPGTTRDVVTARIAVDGWPVELADTAGLRGDAGALEGQGIEQARAAAGAADLCLWVWDATTGPTEPDVSGGLVRTVVNKIDVPPAWDVRQVGDAVKVSAATGQGLDELCAALARWLVPEAPPPGAAVPFTPRLCDAVEEAARHLDAGRVEETRACLRLARET
jgi:tRNA modification GTPase